MALLEIAVEVFEILQMLYLPIRQLFRLKLSESSLVSTLSDLKKKLLCRAI